MTEISEQVDMDNKTIKELKQKRQKLIKKNLKDVFTLVPTALFFPGIFLSIIYFVIEIVKGIIEGATSSLISALIVSIVFKACLEDGFHPVNSLKKLINKILKNKTELKDLNKEIDKRETINKITEIKKGEDIGINIDRKKQQAIDKLLNKLKKKLSKDEYQCTVDELFKKEVVLEDDEYTKTDEKITNIESGNIAYAFSSDNAVKKKILVRKKYK